MRTTSFIAVAVAAVALAAVPGFAATRTLKGTVGPGFSIGVSSKTVKAGRVKLVVSDKAAEHDFHLVGPGVNVKTSIAGTGVKTFLITLKKGSTYRFFCDIHTDLRGSFKTT